MAKGTEPIEPTPTHLVVDYRVDDGHALHTGDPVVVLALRLFDCAPGRFALSPQQAREMAGFLTLAATQAEAYRG